MNRKDRRTLAARNRRPAARQCACCISTIDRGQLNENLEMVDAADPAHGSEVSRSPEARSVEVAPPDLHPDRLEARPLSSRVPALRDVHVRGTDPQLLFAPRRTGLREASRSAEH